MINLHRQNGRAGGGVCIFTHESIDFKERKDLSISKNDSEILSIEITNQTKNILSSAYIPPDSSLKWFKSSLKPIFDNICRNNISLFSLYLVGDFNFLDYENNVKVKNVNFAVWKQFNTSNQ